MIEWIDKSDRSTHFLDADLNNEQISTRRALESIVKVLLDEILGKGNASQFEILMLEVNCDTGRLIAGAATESGWKSGNTDGCSIRVQEIQDYWYDLIEAEIDETQFAFAVRERVDKIGREFKAIIDSSSDVFRSLSAIEGFRLVVFGSTPGDEIVSAVYA